MLLLDEEQLCIVFGTCLDMWFPIHGSSKLCESYSCENPRKG